MNQSNTSHEKITPVDTRVDIPLRCVRLARSSASRRARLFVSSSRCVQSTKRCILNMQPTKSNLDEAKRAAPALFAEVGDWFKLYWQDGDATAIDTFQYLGRTRGVAPPGYLTFKLISRSDGPSEVTDGMCEAVGAPDPAP